MPQLFECSGCGLLKPRSAYHEAHYTDRKRPVTSRCQECRSEDYFSKRYETVCAQCMRHRPLNSNGCCKYCNEEQALRECSACDEILPLFLCFDGKRTTCKNCRKLRQQPTSEPQAGPESASA